MSRTPVVSLKTMSHPEALPRRGKGDAGAASYSFEVEGSTSADGLVFPTGNYGSPEGSFAVTGDGDGSLGALLTLTISPYVVRVNQSIFGGTDDGGGSLDALLTLTASPYVVEITQSTNGGTINVPQGAQSPPSLAAAASELRSEGTNGSE